jgi:hypothetical protein
MLALLEPYPGAATVLVDEFDAPADSVACYLTLPLMPLS